TCGRRRTSIWPCLAGVSLSLCVHGAALYAFIARPASNASAAGNGLDDFTVIAEVRLEGADFLTQRAQEAGTSQTAAQAAPAPAPEEPKAEPSEEAHTEAPLSQQTANATPEPAEIPPEPHREEAPREKQQTIMQTASVEAKAQDEQQAAAALAARRNQ